MRRTVCSLWSITLVVSAALLVVASSASAAAYLDWLADYTDGTYAWSNAAHWEEGRPPSSSTNDVGRFSNVGTGKIFTVQMDTDVNILALKAQAAGSTVNLDLNGHTFATTSTSSSDFIIESSSGEATLGVVNSGTTGAANWKYFTVGRSSGSVGKLTISGSNTKVNATGSTRINIGGSGTGTMNVTAGGSYTGPELTLGYNGSASGTVLVSGANSKVELTGIGSIGYSGTGSLTLEDGGTFATSNHIRIGLLSGSNGTVLVTGVNSRLEGSQIAIGGKDTAIGGTGNVTIANGGSMVAGSSIYVWDGSSLTVNGGTVTGSSSLYLNSGSALALVVNNRAGIVQVSGNLAIDPTASLQLSFGAGLTGSDFIPLIQYGGALSGTFAGLAEGAQFTVGEQVFNLTYTGGDNNNIVGLTAVPEPATMGLLVIGAAGAVIRRRAR